jgi:hypothetical protein
MNQIVNAAEQRQQKDNQTQDSLTNSPAKIDYPIQPTKPNYCNHCQKVGHEDAHCRDIYPDEENPNWCDRCQMGGHWEETCWKRHPELREQYVKELAEKRKKMTCEHCGKQGHWRRFCWKLHPNQKPSQPITQASKPFKLTRQDDDVGGDDGAVFTRPAWSDDGGCCHKCKVYGHRGRNCMAPDVEEVSSYGVSKFQYDGNGTTGYQGALRKPRACARPAKGDNGF